MVYHLGVSPELFFYCMVAKGWHFSHNLIGSLLIEYQVIYRSLTTLRIQVVTLNAENMFSLKSVVSTSFWSFKYFYSVNLQISLTVFEFSLHFHSLNRIIVCSSLAFQLLLPARCFRFCRAHNASDLSVKYQITK